MIDVPPLKMNDIPVLAIASNNPKAKTVRSIMAGSDPVLDLISMICDCV
jgi:hypothetical protein